MSGKKITRSDPKYNDDYTRGYARLTTKTVSGTISSNIYRLALERSSMQWCGREIENTLDDNPYRDFTIDDTQFLFWNMKEYPFDTKDTE